VVNVVGHLVAELLPRLGSGGADDLAKRAQRLPAVEVSRRDVLVDRHREILYQVPVRRTAVPVTSDSR
jgi:hypothetical protein